MLIIDTKTFITKDGDSILGVFGMQGDAHDLLLYNMSDSCNIEHIHVCFGWKGGGYKALEGLAKSLQAIQGGVHEDKWEAIEVEFGTWCGSSMEKDPVTGECVPKEYTSINIKHIKTHGSSDVSEIYMCEADAPTLKALGEWIEEKVKEG